MSSSPDPSQLVVPQSMTVGARRDESPVDLEFPHVTTPAGEPDREGPVGSTRGFVCLTTFPPPRYRCHARLGVPVQSQVRHDARHTSRLRLDQGRYTAFITFTTDCPARSCR